MADQPTPVLSGSVWRALRAQFNRSLPPEVSSNYLATVLSLEDTAAKNVLRNLKLLGLVGDENQLTELAIRWRDDEQFADACQDIARHAYDDELLSAVPGPNPDPKAATRWFQRTRLLGQGAAQNAARTYVLITSAKLPNEVAGSTGNATSDSSGRRGSKATNARPADRGRKHRTARTSGVEMNGTVGGFEMPRPQIAVQINFSPDMTPEQIDQVFASMARHFYNEAGVE